MPDLPAGLVQTVLPLIAEIGSLQTEVKEEIGGLRTETKGEIGSLRTEMNARFDRVYQEIGSLRTETNTRFTWLYGLLVAVVLGIAGLWFK